MGITKSIAKQEIDIKTLSEERQIHYHLPNVGFWTLRSSETITPLPDEKPLPVEHFTMSMFRRCFDNEGNHQIRVFLVSKFQAFQKFVEINANMINFCSLLTFLEIRDRKCSKG